MAKRFLISDMHFGHSNILNYEKRPFEDVSIMDKAIINNWNSIVKHKDDIVFVLGDVSFYPKEETAKIIGQLRGQKRLILGNHDKGRSVKFWHDVGFKEVYHYPVCVDDFYWLSHEPMYLTSTMPYVNVHGHIHSQVISTDGEVNQYFNVSVERIDYTPIDFEKIKQYYNMEEKI